MPDAPPTMDVPVIPDAPPRPDTAPIPDVPQIVDAPPGDGPRIVDVPDGGSCATMSTVGALCTATRVFPCGIFEGPAPAREGMLSTAQCMALCPPNSIFQAYTCSYVTASDGPVTLSCNYACGVGRRADGFTWNATPCNDLGAWFAHVAALEGAAVHAFEHMADALRAWGAPEDLIADALTARDEERTHAALMTALARGAGAEPVAFTVTPTAPTTMRAMAFENAVEGCVRETWGALVACWQRDHARDLAVADAMRTIADDETRHAALSWRLHAWLRTQLDAETFAAVEAARRDAVDALREELRTPFSAAAVAGAGVPDAAMTARLFEALAPTLA